MGRNRGERKVCLKMTAREMVIAHVTARMVEAFTKGDLADAQNMNAFLASLDGMTDAEYRAISHEEVSGAIS